MNTSQLSKAGERMRVSRMRSTHGSVVDTRKARDSLYRFAPPMINPRFNLLSPSALDAFMVSSADFRLLARIVVPAGAPLRT